MPIVSVRIPQLGEGLQEALLVELLKKPGESVKRDDPLYTMETDKATSDVESPYAGTLVEWTVEPGTVLEIGSEVAKMEVAEGVKEMPAGGHGPGTHEETAAEPAASSTASPPASSASKRPSIPIPPRTRKYLREKGMLDIADQIPIQGSKLTPEDVDRYIESQAAGAAGGDASATDAPFDEVDLPIQQQTLNYRLVRGTQVCVPVTVVTEVDWSALEAARAQTRATSGETSFAMLLWCLVQTLKDHSKFRSSLVGDGKRLRTYQNVNLGVAVALPGDLLVTAVVKQADTLDRAAFHQALAQQIEVARNGEDQADAATTISVSNMGTAGMQIGIPAIVAPAVATLVLGQTFWQPVPSGDGFEFKKMARLTLTFDHRVINGVGAGNFMSDLRQRVEAFSL